jgi:hypothetical protein
MCRSLGIAILLAATLVAAQEKAAKPAAKKAGLSDAAYTAQALSAAPKAVAKDAGVMRMGADGSMKMLRESKNGFTCMIVVNDKMCADENSMAFFGAMMKKQDPPDKLGIAYMLRGDQGASNTDPMAEKKTADNHWVVTGPHIMIVGAGVKSLGLSDAADPDPGKPYLMWANTPYAHAMVPVSSPAPAKNAMASSEKKQ